MSQFFSHALSRIKSRLSSNLSTYSHEIEFAAMAVATVEAEKNVVEDVLFCSLGKANENVVDQSISRHSPTLSSNNTERAILPLRPSNKNVTAET